MTPEEWEQDKKDRAMKLWDEKVIRFWQPIFWDFNIGAASFGLAALISLSHFGWFIFFAAGMILCGIGFLVATIQTHRYGGKARKILEEEQ